MIYGDYREPNPPARLMEAVEKGDIDIAAVWGPLAGYAAETSAVPLTVVPITDTEDFAPLRFQFDIAMGVRKRDHALKARLDDILARKQPEIRALLASYGVPMIQDGLAWCRNRYQVGGNLCALPVTALLYCCHRRPRPCDDRHI